MPIYLKIAWESARGLVAIFVVLMAFKIASTPFQTLVIAALALIYVNVLESVAHADDRATKIAEGAFARFVTVLRAVNYPQVDQYAEELNRLKRNNQRPLGRQLIFSATLLIIGLVSLYEIVRTVITVVS